MESSQEVAGNGSLTNRLILFFLIPFPFLSSPSLFLFSSFLLLLLIPYSIFLPLFLFLIPLSFFLLIPYFPSLSFSPYPLNTFPSSPPYLASSSPVTLYLPHYFLRSGRQLKRKKKQKRPRPSFISPYLCLSVCSSVCLGRDNLKYGRERDSTINDTF